MYSQNREEEFIVNYFKDKPAGRFLDIGAFHPFRFSNTRALYEMGWHGILIEPSPICFEKLHEEYKEEPRIVLMNVAVSDCEGYCTFYEETHGHAVSTFSLAHKQKWETGDEFIYKKTRVKTISAQRLENMCPATDFLNIDAEDLSFHIFSSFTNGYLNTVKMICVEHDNNTEAIQNRLHPMGFKTLYLNGENIIMAQQ